VRRQPVTSSDLKSVGYDHQSKTLEVEFHSGGIYEYDGVSASVHSELINAPSVGRYFRAHIRTTYPYRRLD
jgi:hypothetical protein